MKQVQLLMVLFALVLILFPAFALTPADLLWNGFVQVELDKNTFDLNEPITGSIFLNNTEAYSLVDGRIVLQVAQGEYSYPSQTSTDVLLSETSITDVWVLPQSMKKVDFVIPAQKAGTYRLDLYTWVTKSQFIGSSAILYNPLSTTFSVRGSEQKRVVIDRARTTFGPEDTVGPVGFPMEADANFLGNIVLHNTTASAKTNTTIEISLCDWAAAFCTTTTPARFSVPSIAAGAEVIVPVSVIAPHVPSAYEIEITLKNSDGSIESMYKNRVIVSGATAKARKVYITGLDSGQFALNAIFSGSPDHFTNPVFENFEVGAEIYRAGTKLEEHFEPVASLTNEEFLLKTFTVESPQFDAVCIIAQKEGTVYEKECFSVPLVELKEAYKKQQAVPVTVSWNYVDAEGALRVTLTKDDINARVILLDTQSTLFEKDITAKGTATESISVGKKNLTLVVDDKNVKKQQVFDIRLDAASDLSGNVTPTLVDQNGTTLQSVCRTQVCGEESVCSSQTVATIQGACCPTECIPQNTQQSEETIPLIAIVAAGLVVIALFVAITTIRKVRK